MASQFEQLLESLQWTFDTYVKPAVEDPLAASYARTVSVLLSQARARAREEHRALVEDLGDLRETLQSLVAQLAPPQAAETAALLERTRPPPPFAPAEQLERDLAELSAAATAVITVLPQAPRARLEACLVRRIERRARWLPDEAPPNAF